MTWSLVQASAPQANASAATVSIPLSSTGAGNLLVAWASIIGTGTAPTITGWTLVTSVEEPSPLIAFSLIYALFNNAGGITSVSATFAAGSLDWQIAEFTCPNVSAVTAADQTGTVIAASIAATQAITTTGNLAADHELAAACYTNHYSTSSSSTLGPGTGFTQAGQFNNGVTQFQHGELDYNLDTGASTGSAVTDTVTCSLAAAGAVAGVIATFAQPAAAGTDSTPEPATAQSSLAGGSGSWVNPGNATGAPDTSYATWTAP